MLRYINVYKNITSKMNNLDNFLAGEIFATATHSRGGCKGVRGARGARGCSGYNSDRVKVGLPTLIEKYS